MTHFIRLGVRTALIAAAFVISTIITTTAEANAESSPTLGIENGRWTLNGELTNQGSEAEGLLMNVRMVNATFEDRNRSDFDSEANTYAFLRALPEYAASGVNAFTFNLQGGMPGYEKALNSAFNPDGSLRPEYMKRIARVIEACGREGCAVILGLFYQRQDQVLRDADAVRTGVVNAVKWVKQQGYRNVAIEIANEFSHGGFDHAILKTPEGEVELIQLAHQVAPGLLVAASGVGDGRMDAAIAHEADFILIHFNGTPVEQIGERIEALKPFGKPIVCNEDDKTGEEAASALRACVKHGASWGYMNNTVNQYQPFEFNGTKDDPIVYEAFRKAAGK
ncbi:MAG: hypothetical protein GC154_09830 [bacterium]|nr:hypothetical protein [bacterium]